jgi:hypothetical protein
MSASQKGFCLDFIPDDQQFGRDQFCQAMCSSLAKRLQEDGFLEMLDQIKKRLGFVMGNSMAVGLSKPGFIERLDFWLIKLDNQRKFITVMANNGVTSHLL